jgi:glycosyltransferase involved in cell wall biosynthesis
LIPTFVNNNLFEFIPFEQKQTTVAYVGRLENIKGVHILIDAVSLLHKERPDVNWKYFIAGSGEVNYVNKIKEKVNSMNLNEAISFTGNLSSNDLSSLLGRSMLSVIPSLCFENLPNSLLESYASGTPVISSSLGSLIDSVIDNETGFLFRPGDSKQLAEKLAYGWDHYDKLAQMSLNARRLAETKYSQDHHMSSLMDLFGNLLNKKT